MAKRTRSKKTSTKSEEKDLENEKVDESEDKSTLETENEIDEENKITISQYLKENDVSTDAFFNKLLPKLTDLDFNEVYYEKEYLDKLVGE